MRERMGCRPARHGSQWPARAAADEAAAATHLHALLKGDREDIWQQRAACSRADPRSLGGEGLRGRKVSFVTPRLHGL